VQLTPDVVIEANPRDNIASQILGDKPWRVVHQDEQLWVTDDEAALLRLFAEPRRLGEAIFARPEVESVPHARDFLAECLRCHVLCVI